MSNNKQKNVRCSFCGKSQDEVDRIIAGPGVYICDECVRVCANIVEDDLYEDTEMTYTLAENEELPNPAEIKEILELSYNIDDCKYSNGELLEAIEFELLFEDKYGNDKIFKLI